MDQKLKIIFILTCLIKLLESSQNVLSREKRFLVVPATSPTRVQLVSGIGVPLQLENEAITLGITMKAQYFLPETVNQLKWIYFPDIFTNFSANNFFETQQQKFPNGRRRKREISVDEMTGQKYEKYIGEVNEISNVELEDEVPHDENYYDSDDETFEDEFSSNSNIPTLDKFPKPEPEILADTSGTRWLMYDGIAQLLIRKGIPGRPCVLRSICEAAESPFSHYGGLFGEIFHILFTPSTSHDEIINKDHYDYMQAEKWGEAGEPCDKVFHECKTSMMDIFSQVYESRMFKF